MTTRIALCAAVALLVVSGTARADDLYRPSSWSAMSADRKAMQPGDTLTVVVYQTAESTNSAKSDSSRSTNLGGAVAAGRLNESGSLNFGGGYTGGGEVQRSDKFVTQLTVTVDSVLPNGDLQVSGHQRMHINGENTEIGVRGRVRMADIGADNRVLSSRIADAQIDYDGKGFVSRSAKPGLLNRVFRFLGLG
jgi:flagellar L-ring protein precursor FlgH